MSGSDAQPVWIDADTLVENEVVPWMDLPLWLPDEALGMMQVSTARAEAEGLRTRPITETMRDIIEWHHGDPEQLLVGLKPERERELLQKLG